jgi:hypothetical protein
MNRITADNALLVRLREIAEPVDIVDQAGKLMGHYTPVLAPEVEVAYEKAKQSFDPNEMEKRLKEQQGQGTSLEQFWNELKARATP